MNTIPQLRIQFFGTERLATALREIAAPHLPFESLADHYVLGNRWLHQALKAKIDRLVTALAPQLRPSRVAWPNARADVLALDLALVEHPTRPFDLAWVEIQAFTSMLPTFHTLHLAQRRICDPGNTWHPHDPLPARTCWLEHMRQWVAPDASTVLIEDHPHVGPTSLDLDAARHWWRVDIQDWRDLVPADGYLRHAVTNKCYTHVWNRLILSDLPAFERSHARAVLLAAEKVGWHSHPAWYDGINKGSLADIALASHEACYWVDNRPSHGAHWDDAARWVAKAVHGHSGSGLLLNPSADDLAALPGPRRWIVQRKFRQVPIACHPLTQQPLFGEIRCMVGLQAGRKPWVMAWIVRCSTNGIATLTGREAVRGEGMTLLYFNEQESAQ